MWDLPRPGLEPVSPALAGGFLTTVPPGKPLDGVSLAHFIDETAKAKEGSVVRPEVTKLASLEKGPQDQILTLHVSAFSPLSAIRSCLASLAMPYSVTLSHPVRVFQPWHDRCSGLDVSLLGAVALSCAL